MDAGSMKRLVPQFADSDVYICGPEPLLSMIRNVFEDVVGPKNCFHDEAFAFNRGWLLKYFRNNLLHMAD